MPDFTANPYGFALTSGNFQYAIPYRKRIQAINPEWYGKAEMRCRDSLIRNLDRQGIVVQLGFYAEIQVLWTNLNALSRRLACKQKAKEKEEIAHGYFLTGCKGMEIFDVMTENQEVLLKVI